MSSTLSVVSNFSLASQGRTITGKQGAAADGFDTALDITVTGTVHEMIGSLATATVATVYDDDNDLPADWDYLYFWADQDCYIQIIGSGSNAIFKVEATVPFWLPGFDSILAAADTTIITGGSEPTLTDIDSIVIGNYSGNTMNYHFAVID
jgi:hypothetical protein